MSTARLLTGTAASRGAGGRRIAALGALVAGSGLVLVALPNVASATDPPPGCTGTTTVTCTFAYNGTTGSDGTAQTWTVPPGVTSAYFDLFGAKGGDVNGTGGLGGETTGTLRLTPGDVVSLLVGGSGHFNGLGMGQGGFNGGGGTGGGGPGGGATDVRIGGTALGNRVLVAGGGGGGAQDCLSPECGVGGAGGGTAGGKGGATPNAGIGGDGGTQSNPGFGSFGATSGQEGVGGVGYRSGGGGGGGYFGGAGGGEIDATGGGALQEGAGGGGSGFFNPDPTRVTGGSTFAGIRDGVEPEGEGLITLTYTTAPATATTTSVASSHNPSSPGQSVTFTATVGPNDGTGTVGFFADGSTTPISGCGAVPLANSGGSWHATCTVAAGFPAGTHPIQASYSGTALYAPSSGSLSGGQRVAAAAKPSIRIADATTTEGNSGTHPLRFRVTLNRSSSTPVTVHWNTADGSAKAPSDYLSGNGTLTFAPGQTSRTVSSAVKGDTVKEPNEVFYLLLTNPHNATIADPNASGGILNDD